MDDGGLYADVLPEFDGHRSERLACFERCGDRALFYFLINYEADPDIVWAAYDRIRSCLAVVPPEGRLPVQVPCDGAAVEECLEALAGTHPRQFDVQGHDQAIECVRQYAPSALLEGCWLQNISAAATCHTEVAAHLFRSYMVGVGHGNNRYRSLLRRFGIDLPSVTTQAFSEHPELVDAAFHAPVVQLCLSLFPRVFLPELIGFTLAHANTTPAWLPLCALLLPDLAELPDAASLAPARRAAGLALHAYLAGCGAGSRQTSWQRIRRGFALYRWAELDLSKRLEERLGQPPTPRDRMIALLRQKAPYARGHHRAACIGGKEIDAWFSEDPFDAEGFLDALVQSDFVVPKAPAKSRLLADLTDFGGPMFRVFDEAERRVILEWLKSLSDQKIPPASTDPAAPMIRPASWSHVVARVHVQDRGHASTDARQLFYRLVNSDLFPDVLPAAQRIVSRHLRKSAAGLTDRLPPLRQFFPYTHGAFQARIESLYEKERDAYRPFEPPPRLRRDVYVWGIEQMAPIVLVDGCWLQHVVQAGNRDSRLAAALFGIYADEVGNGHTRLNHPNVYRRLLQSLDIDLPPLNDPAFPAYPGFLDAAFDLPVYLLAIAHFPKTFLPEIIGLNLAIELSGLGARYMRLVDELDHWGIDSTIIRLHISIDNMAGGHAAIARDGVGLYLDQILACSGEAVMQQHWRRIWTGFLSLNRVSKRFGLALAWHYGTRFALPRWYRRMARRLSENSDRSEGETD